MEHITDKVSFERRGTRITLATDMHRLLAIVAEQAYIAGLNHASLTSNNCVPVTEPRYIEQGSPLANLNPCDVGYYRMMVNNYLKDKGFIK